VQLAELVGAVLLGTVDVEGVVEMVARVLLVGLAEVTEEDDEGAFVDSVLDTAALEDVTVEMGEVTETRVLKVVELENSITELEAGVELGMVELEADDETLAEIEMTEEDEDEAEAEAEAKDEEAKVEVVPTDSELAESPVFEDCEALELTGVELRELEAGMSLEVAFELDRLKLETVELEYTLLEPVENVA